MPYQIPGQPGTWYEPGERKRSRTIIWRGQLPDGQWTELVTNATDRAGAQAYLRAALQRWHRDRPPAAGEQVSLAIAAHHYAAADARSDVERARVARVVRYLGPETSVGAINQAHVTAAAAAFRAERARANAVARATGRQAYPPPSAGTINREVTTPLRAIVHFAARQGWRGWTPLAAVRRPEGEVPSRQRPAARDDDVARLLSAIAAASAQIRPLESGRQKASDRRRGTLNALYALILLVHERGYRIGEWLRWDWETIDLAAGRARILLSKPDRWADFEISPEAVAALAALDARPAGRVFPWHGRSAVYGAVDAIAPEGIRWRPHDSRRAVVTAVLRNTGDPTVARDYVGHASVKTTLRYSVVDPGEVRPQVRQPGHVRPRRAGKRGNP